MDLILWRHAEAEDGVPDSARKLTKKGRRQAEKMADWLKARLPKHAVVLASPAARTRETAEALSDSAQPSDALGLAASPESVLQAAGWPGNDETVVVVGHQPTLGQVAALLLSGERADWSIPKGAVWWLRRRDGETVLRAALPPEFL